MEIDHGDWSWRYVDRWLVLVALTGNSICMRWKSWDMTWIRVINGLGYPVYTFCRRVVIDTWYSITESDTVAGVVDAICPCKHHLVMRVYSVQQNRFGTIIPPSTCCSSLAGSIYFQVHCRGSKLMGSMRCVILRHLQLTSSLDWSFEGHPNCLLGFYTVWSNSAASELRINYLDRSSGPGTNGSSEKEIKNTLGMFKWHVTISESGQRSTEITHWWMNVLGQFIRRAQAWFQNIWYFILASSPSKSSSTPINKCEDNISCKHIWNRLSVDMNDFLSLITNTYNIRRTT